MLYRYLLLQFLSILNFKHINAELSSFQKKIFVAFFKIDEETSAIRKQVSDDFESKIASIKQQMEQESKEALEAERQKHQTGILFHDVFLTSRDCLFFIFYI